MRLEKNEDPIPFYYFHLNDNVLPLSQWKWEHFESPRELQKWKHTPPVRFPFRISILLWFYYKPTYPLSQFHLHMRLFHSFPQLGYRIQSSFKLENLELFNLSPEVNFESHQNQTASSLNPNNFSTFTFPSQNKIRAQLIVLLVVFILWSSLSTLR